jgi:hypothetical protein
MQNSNNDESSYLDPFSLTKYYEILHNESLTDNNSSNNTTKIKDALSDQRVFQLGDASSTSPEKKVRQAIELLNPHRILLSRNFHTRNRTTGQNGGA